MNHFSISALGATDEKELQMTEMWRGAVGDDSSADGGCRLHLETVVVVSSISSLLKRARLGCLWLQLLWRS